MILSTHAKSIILSAPPAEGMILSASPACKPALRVSAQACPQADSIILSAGGAASMVLSARAESIVLSAGEAESVILSTRADIIILSAPLAESMMLSAPQKHCHRSIFLYSRLVFFFAKVNYNTPLPIVPDFRYSFGFWIFSRPKVRIRTER